jgi:hypothetical protein
MVRELETRDTKRPQGQLERARAQAGVIIDDALQPVAK